MEQGLPRRAIFQRLKRRLLRGILQYQPPGILQATRAGSRLGDGQIGRAQPRELLDIIHHQTARLGGGQQLVGKLRAESGRFLVQRL